MKTVEGRPGAGRQFVPALTLAAAAAVMWYRKPGSLSHPQFWAEDGTIFFADQWNVGAAALLKPYANYFHLVPRLVAMATDVLVPIRFAPHAYVYASFLIALAVLYGIFSPRVRLPFKPAIVLSVVLVPMIQNEIFFSLTNIQWLMAIYLVVLLVKTGPDRTCRGAIDMATAFACGLTGPFILIMTPFFAGKFAKERTAWSAGLFLVSMVTGGAQAWHVWAGEAGSGIASCDVQTYAAILGHKWLGTIFIGYSESAGINPWLIGLVGLGVVASLGGYGWRRGSIQPSLFLMIGIALLAAALFKHRGDPEKLLYPMNGIRYFFLPSVMITWSLLASIPTAGRAVRTLVFILLALMASASFRTYFRNDLVEMKDYDWPRHSAHIGAEYVEIPINPEGWKIKLNPPPDQATRPRP